MHRLAILSFVGGLCSSILVSTLQADGPGGYGNVPYAWIRAGEYETEETTLYDEASSEWHWGASPILGTAYALGDIQTAASAMAKARSEIGYHDPYGSGALSIGADVETWKPFLVVSDTLAAGTAVDVWLQFHYSGTLYAKEGVDGMYCYAHASGAVTLYDNGGAILASRAGEAEVECELLDGERELMSEATGAWAGHLAYVDPMTESGPYYSLSYGETIHFTATVGSQYWLYFDLATSANSSAGDSLGWEGSATCAIADFSNTGEYLLGSNADVNFVIVPEPSTRFLAAALTLAISGYYGVRGRRRSMSYFTSTL